MSRPRSCKICNDLAVAGRVNALLETGVRQKVIAQQVPDFSVSQISRHKRNCLAVKGAPELTPDAGSAEIQKWLERAESTFLLIIA